jgi:homoserine dehydrogenase
MTAEITILKFGSSVLKSDADLPRAVHEIYRHWRQGSQVLVVVSALGATTDKLLLRAKNLHGEPHSESLAALLATGEAAAAALLGLAAHGAGLPVKVFTPEQINLQTAGATLNAEPIAVDIARLRRNLQDAIVIVSGFVGLNAEGDLTLLGRGGSDYTALFLAEKLGGRCVLIKDVDGLYETNPRRNANASRRFARADWETVVRVGGEIVQPKAIRFARRHNLHFSIAAVGANFRTEIGSGRNKFACDEYDKKKPRLRVALLGCGTVGGGVYRRLAELPEFFEITGVVDRNREKAFAAGVPERLWRTDAAQLIEKKCDVVVELFGGVEPTRALITRALDLRRNVVTANKALLAEQIKDLENLARKRGVKILYSAAVGGAMPALETIALDQFSKNLRSVSGIVNGTCNFICDQLANGANLAATVAAAQAAGFAEADPTLDINGTDAAQKLILLARAAFGATLSLAEIRREGLENLSAARVCESLKKGCVVRLVAECRRAPRGIKASVRLVELPVAHPFAQTRGAENCLRLETLDGTVKFIRGKGAGRWATTEAVIADLLDLWRESFFLATAFPQTGAEGFSLPNVSQAKARTANPLEVFV